MYKLFTRALTEAITRINNLSGINLGQTRLNSVRNFMTVSNLLNCSFLTTMYILYNSNRIGLILYELKAFLELHAIVVTRLSSLCLTEYSSTALFRSKRIFSLIFMKTCISK
jgi:hypothetical protein